MSGEVEAPADVTREAAIDAYWAGLDDEEPLDSVELRLLELCAGLSDDRILYERAGLRDALGLEADARPLYERALAGSLESPHRERATIQLASTVCNLGEPHLAEELLRPLLGDATVAPQASAFLALADQGQDREALRVAMRALATRLPEYNRAAAFYVAELG